MKHFLCVMISVFCFVLCAQGEIKDTRLQNKSEIRIGIGDALADYYPEVLNKWSTGHLFVEYQYRINTWLGVGGMYDVVANQYKEYYVSPEEPYDSYRYLTAQSHYIMPTVRFTYLNREWINLYSGVGVGLWIYTNNQPQLYCGFAVNATLLGLSIGKKHWFGAVELGNMFSFTKGDSDRWTAWRAFERFLTVSFGYRF